MSTGCTVYLSDDGLEQVICMKDTRNAIISPPPVSHFVFISVQLLYIAHKNFLKIQSLYISFISWIYINSKSFNTIFYQNLNLFNVICRLCSLIIRKNQTIIDFYSNSKIWKSIWIAIRVVEIKSFMASRFWVLFK